MARLQRLLTLVGDFESAVDGAFGPLTEAAVRAFQREHGLSNGGIAGPRTWSRLSELVFDGEEPLRLLRHARGEAAAEAMDLAPPAEAALPEPADTQPEASAPPHDADRAGQILATAEAEWRRPVLEPEGTGWERIDEYIRGPQRLHWTWEDRYVRNLQFAWCGAFAAFCYQAAGLRAEVRKKVMPSTYRLYR